MLVPSHRCFDGCQHLPPFVDACLDWGRVHPVQGPRLCRERWPHAHETTR